MPALEDAPFRFDKNATASANETFRVDFPAPIGDAATNKGVGKGDKAVGNFDPNNNQYAALSDDNLTEDRGTVIKEMNLITRSVASSEVNRALGLNTVVAEAYSAAPDGSNIGVSAFASGEQLMTITTDANGNQENTITREFEFNRPEIQKGLYDLEATDYLTGQIDRHAGNIFINNATGQVEGIDNDLCLGEKPLAEAVLDGEVGAKAAGVPPLYYHEDTAAAIEQLTPEKLAGILQSAADANGGHKLADKEIQAAQARLENMKACITLARAEGRVVAKFDDATFAASVKHHQEKAGERTFSGKLTGCGNYVGRCQVDLEYAKQQSLKPGSADVIQKPDGPRPLNAYEQGLQGHKDAVQKARTDALAAPGAALAAPLQQKQQAEALVKDLRAQIKTEMQAAQHGLDRNLGIVSKAYEARQANLQTLKDISDTRTVGEGNQAALLKTMAGLDGLQAGQRLDNGQKQDLDRAIKRLNNRILVEARQEENKYQTQHVQHVAPELQAALKEATQELEAANTQVEQALQNEPGVKQATAAQQNFIQSSKAGLVQDYQNEQVAKAAQAQLQSDLKFAESLQRQDDLRDLAESVAKSNNISFESLNLTRGGNLQTPAQLRSSAINSRDDAGASRLAGDQMAGTVDHDNLSEGDALAMEGTLQQLGQGSDLEVAKMYARGDELNALADVQARFGEITQAVNEGKEPTQQQLEGFGAAVQALSESAQKSQRATQAVSDSIQKRLQTGLEAKVGPLLDQKGYTPQEKAASIEALTAAALDIDIMKLRDTDERADLYVDQMAAGIAESEFDYPGGNKVHEAVYRAFDATAVAVPDGSIAVKPAGGGQTFNEKRANEHISKALEKQGMPVPELPQGPARQAALAPQLEAGQERVEIYNSKVALEAEKTAEIKSLKAHLGELEEKKDHLQNHPSKGEKFKALLKNGPKGIAAEVAKVDMEILATKKALETVQNGTGLDQQKAELHQMKGDLRAGRQQLDQVNKDLKAAEKTIKSAGLQGTLDNAMLGPMSDKERDALVRQANAAINVREALKPHAQQLKEAHMDLKAEVKMGEKAASVRDKVGGKPGQAAIGGHRGGHHA